MNQFPGPPVRLLLVLAMVMAGTASFANAQMREANPESSDALAKLVQAVRSAPRMAVEEVVVTTRQGELEEAAPPRRLRWTLIPEQGLRTSFDGFDIRLANGRLQAIHESRDDLVIDQDDKGSPYYALFSQFRDLPWPGLALAIGEVEPEDCAMQMNTRAPWLQPTGLASRPADEKGKIPARRRIELSSDIEDMWIDVDEKTGLPVEAEVTIHGGRFVEEGTELIFRYTWKFEPVADPKKALDLPTQGREQVDMVSALVRREPPRGGGAGEGGLQPGRTAPTFDLHGLEEEKIVLEGLRGRVVVLDFWATWCGPCRAALPRLAELGLWAEDKGIPLEVIAVNTSEQTRTLEPRRRRIREFLTESKLDLDGLRVALDLDGRIAGAYGVQGLPTTVIVDADGRVVSVKVGFGPGAEERLREDLLDLFEGGERGGEGDDVS